jgi:hypothetical protein
VVEHFLGKEEVEGSIPSNGSVRMVKEQYGDLKKFGSFTLHHEYFSVTIVTPQLKKDKDG